MKLQELKIPYGIHCVFPAAILATCLVILAVVRLHPGCTQLLPLVASSEETDDGWRTDSGNQSSCDIFKGEWVPDPGARKPYTPETCPVIHGHYDCMRYGRPDTGLVQWRWRPVDCDLLPRFLAAMRGRSVAFVGDSLARNQMHSLVCLLASAEQPTPWTRNASSHVYRYNHHDFTVALFWSPFLVRAVEEADPDGPARSGAGLWRLHLDKPDPGWTAHVAGFDVVVISASSWFYRPAMLYEADTLVGCSGCLRPNVTDLTVRYSLRMAFRTALRRAAAVGDGRRGRTVVVRTFSPAHYENGTGDGGATADCVRTRPLRRGEKWEVNALEKEMYAIQREEFSAAEEEASREGKKRKGVRMMLLDATEAMAQRPDAHPGRYRLWQPDRFNVSRDCLHWCLPGAMDACNDMLQHMLLR